MMLFPNNKEPETGSRIPSMSTGGAATKAMMYTDTANRDHDNTEPTYV
jgi:hypothetical protein